MSAQPKREHFPVPVCRRDRFAPRVSYAACPGKGHEIEIRTLDVSCRPGTTTPEANDCPTNRVVLKKRCSTRSKRTREQCEQASRRNLFGLPPQGAACFDHLSRILKPGGRIRIRP